MSQVAVLGMGAMGQRIAQNLLAAQHHVFVYNRTPEKTGPLVAQGAVVAPTPRAAAEQADVVISIVTDNEASEAVWLHPEDGAAWGMKAGAIAIESSTLTVTWTQTLAHRLEQHGAQFLDAPVLGSRPQAETQQLIYVVGGTPNTLAQVEDVLLDTGTAVHLIGGTGQGMAMKLAINAFFGIQVAAFAEILGLLTHSNLSLSEAWTCLEGLPVISPAVRSAGQLMIAHQHTPLFPVHLVDKDCRYGLQTAQDFGAAMPTLNRVQAVFADAITQGYGNENITSVIKLFHP